MDRHPRDLAAVAPPTRGASLDPPSETARATIHDGTRGWIADGDGPYESDVGLPADPRELTGLGHRIGASTVWQILRDHQIEPSPLRSTVTWSDFLRSQAAVACDFACVDTMMMRRYYLLFYIDISTRRVFYAGITAHPTGEWTTQAARNLFLRHRESLGLCKALVADRGSQFTAGFDEVFRS